MARSTRAILFSLFFLSGFCALLYQMVWTRLAFASFGIIAPVLSVVLSIFMLGLAVGAWAGGRMANVLQARRRNFPIFCYAASEVVIGIGAFVVPALFRASQRMLLAAGEMDSTRYLFFSALALSMSILPWCLSMGATLPFMMAFIRRCSSQNKDSFSFLYTANVLGAMTGTAVTAVVLIELLGFRHTLFIAGGINFLIAAVACILGWLRPQSETSSSLGGNGGTISSVGVATPVAKTILFSTGFCAMAMEVVWIRSFTPVMQTEVYAFALILVTYLGATLIGSMLYRRDLRRNRARSVSAIAAVLAVSVFLPLICSDLGILTRLTTSLYVGSLILMLSICSVCAALGYLTPGLIDRSGAGEPARASRAYAVNVLGCILGPLVASYLLLPSLGERFSLLLLGAPLLLFYFIGRKGLRFGARVVVDLAAVILLGWASFFAVDFAGHMSRHVRTEVHRDYAASVVAAGEGKNKQLLVNGVGVTTLIATTKIMMHMSIAAHNGPPESALIICFGMGTTFRSALSWDLSATAVELVPGVRDSFAFFHSDAPENLRNPKARIVIDDGRRYLERTREKYDIIIVDPPPPPPAAGSSLLYSEEFYDAAKRDLKANGILQAWVPNAEPLTIQAALRSIVNSFRYVRCYRSPGEMGTHILASMEPFDLNAEKFAAAMPLAAQRDLLEWSEGYSLAQYIALILAEPLPVEEMLNPDPRIRITDDCPFNEYFLLRQFGL